MWSASGMAEEKDMLARKHRGSWQALTPQSNEERLSINSWLLATHTHNRKERPEDEHFLHIRLKGHVRTACSSLPPGSTLTTFLLHPSSCAILRGKEGLLVSTTITDVFLASYAVILMYFAWLTFNPW